MSKEGKRYSCEVCGTQVICVKEGPEQPSCCDAEMTEQSTSINAASD